MPGAACARLIDIANRHKEIHMTNRQQKHLAAIAAEPDVDDWSELEAMHAAQRRAKDAAMSDTQRVGCDLALCARLVLLENPALDPVIVPLFERLECDLRMLRARDRVLGPSTDCQPFNGEHGK
jgi:hypothetical protein